MDPKNGEQPAYVRSAALRGAAVLLQELGVDGVVLARECGLDAAALDNSDLPVPGAAVVAFFEAAADRSGREDFGLLLAARQDLSVLGPVWEAMRSAGTVLDALQVLSHFFVVHTNGAIVGLQRLAEGAAVLTYAIRADVTARDRQTIELGFALVCQELRRHCGAAWVPVAVQLAHAAPRRLASHRRCFGRNLSFAQERNAVWLDRACLQTPIGGHSHAEYVSQMRSLVPRVDRAQTVVADVELAMRALMPVADCNREQVARMTGQSPRTMQRRLAAVGSTFHRLRDRVRADIAMKYLVQSTLPASQIAELPAMPTQRPSRGPSSASTACHQARCGGARADVAGGVCVAVFKSHALSANEFRNLRSGCLSGGFVAAMLGKEVLL